MTGRFIRRTVILYKTAAVYTEDPWAYTALIQENAFTVHRMEEKTEDSPGKILRKMAKCF